MAFRKFGSRSAMLMRSPQTSSRSCICSGVKVWGTSRYQSLRLPKSWVTMRWAVSRHIPTSSDAMSLTQQDCGKFDLCNSFAITCFKLTLLPCQICRARLLQTKIAIWVLHFLYVVRGACSCRPTSSRGVFNGVPPFSEAFKPLLHSLQGDSTFFVNCYQHFMSLFR
ncbi:hypothetical protein AVEN_161464-1 [Araneus ventricosus]|uniref:Uncharacterized protein n=1 Tax=Araneus ventricosus TaxID=182803 RepID=A0A4Y2IJ57_ARAVE|nr:hypothetical protein AVEN_161464-1 [Araneus ventricosus]